ncbi:hypothetical protein A6M14_01040 [Acinetobacter sp. Ac_877]|uniref:hypothetical protein n=1 Tax=Acinetobacter portensis TaxID=1839785 RepID=UPI00128D40F7|nr:hypothetical protein [Acinetobacter portensis]MPW41876.1 hypothetical protein [Acinetobacter portensis]
MNINLYQIQYDENTAAKDASGLLTFDCRENPEFLKRETAHLIRFYDELIVHANNDDYFGLFSPKFEQKVGLKIHQVKDFISDNQGYDVYLFNPFPMLVYKYMNMWEQSELNHPGILNIVDELFEKSGIDFKASSLSRQTESQVVYCNYWVGKKEFIDNFICFLKRLEKTIDENENLKTKIFNDAQYDLSEACFYPFVFERLLSVYLCLNPTYKAISYKYNRNDFVVNHLNKIEKKFYLSDVKHDFDVWECQNFEKIDEVEIRINILKNFLRPKYGIGLIESIMRKINMFRFNSLRKKILSVIK